MALAVLELHHSRPLSPTRRLSLGEHSLPADPAPGWAGVLLGGIAATHRSGLPRDAVEDLQLLLEQIRRGERVVQPRLRHRFQDDQVGLVKSRFALLSHNGSVKFSFSDQMGTALQYLLGAAYAAETVPEPSRSAVIDSIRAGLRWTGRMDDRLVDHLAGHGTSDRFDDPVRWALFQLGLESVGSAPSREQVQAGFRRRLRTAHPDHGGDASAAGDRIADLREARRILTFERRSVG